MFSLATIEVIQPSAFISYRRLPSAMLATLIQTRLQTQGIDAYVDTRKLDGGGPFPKRLLGAIEDNDVFVCLLGEATFESDWVQQEIAQAHHLGKLMIPIFQESYQPPRGALAAHVEALLQNDGIHIFDIKNIYVDEAINKLAEMIKTVTRK